MTVGSMARIGLFCAVLLAGCSTAPQREASTETSALGEEIARNALSLLGRPYRYGGSDPAGFDCSGLVRFVHGQSHIEVPRTAAEQYRSARSVRLADLAAGDLLFFRIDSPGVSHVAIYIGDGRFVHAPQTGRPVELRMLDDGFYRSRLAGAGRLF